MKLKEYWLKQSKKVHWYKKPKITLTKKKNNYVDWFPDGKINIFYFKLFINVPFFSNSLNSWYPPT